MAPQRTRAGRRIPAGAYKIVMDLALTKGPQLSAAQVHKELVHLRGVDDVSLRTVQRILEEVRTGDPGALWSIEDAEGPEEVMLVLPVLRAILLRASLTWRSPRLSQAEAKAVARIRSTAPDLPPWSVYQLVRWLMAGVVEARDVDAYLAFGPWRDPSEAVKYVDVCQAGGAAFLNVIYEDPETVIAAELRIRHEEASDGT